MDGSHDYASKADLPSFATKAKLGALDLRLVREMNAPNWRLIGALVAVAGMTAAVSHRL